MMHKENKLENILENVTIKPVKNNIYEINYNNKLSVYISISYLNNYKSYLTEKDKEQIFKGALLLLYNKQDKKDYFHQNISLEAILPEIGQVPDGSLGGGSDGYGHMFTVLGVFIPSENRILLVNSADENILNHELGHWFAHWMGMPQPTKQIAEELAEKHKYEGRSLFESIKNSNHSRYIKKAA